MDQTQNLRIEQIKTWELLFSITNCQSTDKTNFILFLKEHTKKLWTRLFEKNIPFLWIA